MAEYEEAVRNAKALLDQRSDGLWIKSAFVTYSADLATGLSMRRLSVERHRELLIQLMNIQQDLWEIGTLLDRLAWSQKACLTNTIDEGRWRAWGAVDIEHFHVLVRSILDYVTVCIWRAAAKPGSVPDESFRKLQQWLNASRGNERRLGADLAAIVRSAGWFPSFREVRDSVVHQGGHTVVYGLAGDGILFQVNLWPHGKVRDTAFMYNGAVADFRAYAVVAFAQVLLLLEDLAAALRRRFPTSEPVMLDARTGGPGLDVFSKWADDYLTGRIPAKAPKA